jgi:hypothetical protein
VQTGVSSRISQQDVWGNVSSARAYGMERTEKVRVSIFPNCVRSELKKIARAVSMVARMHAERAAVCGRGLRHRSYLSRPTGVF